jgi:hypothetical protein
MVRFDATMNASLAEARATELETRSDDDDLQFEWNQGASGADWIPLPLCGAVPNDDDPPP